MEFSARAAGEAPLKPDKAVSLFIDETIDSLIMWELLAFLWQNPGVTDKAEGIAWRLGRRREDLVPSLRALRDKGVVEAWGEEEDPIYSFTPGPDKAGVIEQFMRLNEDKEGKLWIWTRLLHKGLR